MVVGQEGKDQEGIEQDEPPQQLSLLQRIDRLDYLMQALEERHCCSSRHGSPSSRTANGMEDGEGNHACKTVTTVLEEVQSKGTLLERVAVLEDRLMQLNLEVEAGHAPKSSPSVAAAERVTPELESSPSDVLVAVPPPMTNHEEKPKPLPTHEMGLGEERKQRKIRHGRRRRWSIFSGRKMSCCSSRCEWDVVRLNSSPNPSSLN